MTRWGDGSNQQHNRPEVVPCLVDQTVGARVGRAHVDVGLAASRAVLLDVLLELQEHRDAFVVIGAQAVHEHTSGLAIASTATTDADMAVIPALLALSPIEDALRRAGLTLKDEARPGVWQMGSGLDGIGVDFLVPESLAGRGRRGATLEGHSRHAVGRAAGLELAMLDHAAMTLRDFDGGNRSVTVKMAGPAALMCAKAVKLSDRVTERANGRRDRVRPKDAVDVWRLIATTDPTWAAESMTRGFSDPVLGEAVRSAFDKFTELFGEWDSEGNRWALRGVDAQSAWAGERRQHHDAWFGAFRRAAQTSRS